MLIYQNSYNHFVIIMSKWIQERWKGNARNEEIKAYLSEKSFLFLAKFTWHFLLDRQYISAFLHLGKKWSFVLVNEWILLVIIHPLFSHSYCYMLNHKRDEIQSLFYVSEFKLRLPIGLLKYEVMWKWITFISSILREDMG